MNILNNNNIIINNSIININIITTNNDNNNNIIININNNIITTNDDNNNNIIININNNCSINNNKNSTSFFSSGTWAQLEPNCPVYVSEGQKLSCTCTYQSVTPPVGTPQFSWPNHSTTATLEKDSVQRADNGTTFTCQMSLGGQTNTTVYTLQVACEYWGHILPSLCCVVAVRIGSHPPVFLLCCSGEYWVTATRLSVVL